MGFFEKAKDFANNLIEQGSNIVDKGLDLAGGIVGAGASWAGGFVGEAASAIENGVAKASQWFGDDPYTNNGLRKGADIGMISQSFKTINEQIKNTDPKDLNAQLGLKESINQQLKANGLAERDLNFQEIENIAKEANKDFGTSYDISRITNEIGDWSNKKVNDSLTSLQNSTINPRDMESFQNGYITDIKQQSQNILNDKYNNSFSQYKGIKINPSNIDTFLTVAEEPMMDVYTKLLQTKKEAENYLNDATKNPSLKNKEDAANLLNEANQRINDFKEKAPKYQIAIAEKMINQGLSGKEAYNEVDRESNGDLSSIVTTSVGLNGYTENDSGYKSPGLLGNFSAFLSNAASTAGLLSANPYVKGGVLATQAGLNIAEGDFVDKGGLDLVQEINLLNADRSSNALSRWITKGITKLGPYSQGITAALFTADQSTSASRAGYKILDNPFEVNALDNLITKVNADLPEIATTIALGNAADDILLNPIVQKGIAFGSAKGTKMLNDVLTNTIKGKILNKSASIIADTTLTNSYIQGFTVDGATTNDVILDVISGSIGFAPIIAANNLGIIKKVANEGFSPAVKNAIATETVNTVYKNQPSWFKEKYVELYTNAKTNIEDVKNTVMGYIIGNETKKSAVQQSAIDQGNVIQDSAKKQVMRSYTEEPLTDVTKNSLTKVNSAKTTGEVTAALVDYINDGKKVIVNGNPITTLDSTNIDNTPPSGKGRKEKFSITRTDDITPTVEEITQTTRTDRDQVYKALPAPKVTNLSKSTKAVSAKFAKVLGNLEGIDSIAIADEMIGQILTKARQLDAAQPLDSLLDDTINQLNDLSEAERMGVMAGWAFQTNHPIVKTLSRQMGGDAHVLKFIIDSTPDMSTTTRNKIQAYWMAHFASYNQGGIIKLLVNKETDLLDTAQELVPDKEFKNTDNIKQYLIARLNESETPQLFGNDLKLANEYLGTNMSPNKETAIEQLNNRVPIAKDLEEVQRKLGDDSALAPEVLVTEKIYRAIQNNVPLLEIDNLFGTNFAVLNDLPSLPEKYLNDLPTPYDGDTLYSKILLHVSSQYQSSAKALEPLRVARAEIIRRITPRPAGQFINFSKEGYNYFNIQLERAVRTKNVEWIARAKQYVEQVYAHQVPLNLSNDLDQVYTRYMDALNRANSKDNLSYAEQNAIRDAVISRIEIDELPDDLQEQVLRGYSSTNLPVEGLKEIVNEAILYMNTGKVTNPTNLAIVNDLIENSGLLQSLHPNMLSNDPAAVELKSYIKRNLNNTLSADDITNELIDRLAFAAFPNGKVDDGLDTIAKKYVSVKKYDKANDIAEQLLAINRKNWNILVKNINDPRKLYNKLVQFQLSPLKADQLIAKVGNDIQALYEGLQSYLPFFSFDKAYIIDKYNKAPSAAEALIPHNVLGDFKDKVLLKNNYQELSAYIVDNNLMNWDELYKKMSLNSKKSLVERLGLESNKSVNELVDIINKSPVKVKNKYKKYITSLTNNLKLEQLLDLRKQFKNPNLVRDLLNFIENVNLQRESSESLFVSRFAHHSSIENLNAKGPSAFIEVTNSHSGGSIYKAESALRREYQLVNDLGKKATNIGSTLLEGQDLFLDKDGFEIILSKVKKGTNLYLSQKLDWMNKRRVDQVKDFHGINIIMPESRFEFTIDDAGTIGVALRDQGLFGSIKNENQFMSARHLKPEQSVIDEATRILFHIEGSEVQNYLGYIDGASTFTTAYVGDYTWKGNSYASKVKNNILTNQYINFEGGLTFLKDLYFGQDAKIIGRDGAVTSIGERIALNKSKVLEARNKIADLVFYSPDNKNKLHAIFEEVLGAKIEGHTYSSDITGITLGLMDRGFNLNRNDQALIKRIQTDSSIDQLNGNIDLEYDTLDYKTKNSLLSFFERNKKPLLSERTQVKLYNKNDLDIDTSLFEDGDESSAATKVTITTVNKNKEKVATALDMLVYMKNQLYNPDKGDLTAINESAYNAFMDGRADHVYKISDEKYIIGTIANNGKRMAPADIRGAIEDKGIAYKKRTKFNTDGTVDKLNKVLFQKGDDINFIQKTFDSIKTQFANNIFGGYSFKTVATPNPVETIYIDGSPSRISINNDIRASDKYKEDVIKYFEGTQKEILNIMDRLSKMTVLEKVTQMSKEGFLYVPMYYTISEKKLPILGLKKLTFADFIPYQVEKMQKSNLLKGAAEKELAQQILDNKTWNNQQKLDAYIGLHVEVFSREHTKFEKINFDNFYSKDNVESILESWRYKDLKKQIAELPKANATTKTKNIHANLPRSSQMAISADELESYLKNNSFEDLAKSLNIEEVNTLNGTRYENAPAKSIYFEGSSTGSYSESKDIRSSTASYTQSGGIWLHSYLNDLLKQFDSKVYPDNPKIYDKLFDLDNKNPEATVKLLKELEDGYIPQLKKDLIQKIKEETSPKVQSIINKYFLDDMVNMLNQNKIKAKPRGLELLADILQLTPSEYLNNGWKDFIPSFNQFASKYEMDSMFGLMKVDNSDSIGSRVGLTYGLVTPEFYSGVFTHLKNLYKGYGLPDVGAMTLINNKYKSLFDDVELSQAVLKGEASRLDLENETRKDYEYDKSSAIETYVAEVERLSPLADEIMFKKIDSEAKKNINDLNNCA